MHRPAQLCASGLLLGALVVACSTSQATRDASVATDVGARPPCQSDLDCTGSLHCYLRAGACSECAYDADCADGSSCEGGACVAHPACANSFDCTGGEVCDPASLRCRECGGAADCDTDQTCRANRCVPRCQSDNECVGLGLLCDGEACVRCNQTVDCPVAYYCAQNECIRDECESGRRWCLDDDTIGQCEFDGSALSETNCVTGRSCRDDGVDIQCEPWTCEPGEALCSGDRTQVVTCDPNGFTSTLTESCGQGFRCYDGACYANVCQPATLGCSANELQLQRCNDTGSGWTLQQNCADTGQFCTRPLVGIATCRPRVCPPRAEECSDGETLSTCAPSGSGFEAVEADCSASGTYCAAGACGLVGEEWIAREAYSEYSPVWSTTTYSTFFVPDVARTLTSVSVRAGSLSDIGDAVHADSVVRVYELDAGTSTSSLIATLPFASLVIDAGRFLTTSPASVALVPGNTYEIAVTLRSGSAGATTLAIAMGSDDIAIGTVTGSHYRQGQPTEMSTPSLGGTRFSVRFTHAAAP